MPLVPQKPAQEWLHCNKCMRFTPESGNEILIGECGHFCCRRCLLEAQRDARSERRTCAVCGSTNGLWCSLLGENGDGELSPEVERMVLSTREQVQGLMGIWELQESNSDSLISFLKQAAASLQSKAASLSESLEKAKTMIRELQVANQELDKENRSLKGGVGGGSAGNGSGRASISQRQRSNSTHQQPQTPQRFSLRPSSRGSSSSGGVGAFNPSRIVAQPYPLQKPPNVSRSGSSITAASPYRASISSHAALQSQNRPTSSQSQQSARAYASKKAPVSSRFSNTNTATGYMIPAPAVNKTYANNLLSRSASNRSISSATANSRTGRNHLAY